MGRRGTTAKNTGVGLLAAAVASGMLGAAAVGTSPTAVASCASFFGISSSADCSSNFTSVAIALGVGATAHADGLFGSAFALGDSNVASLTSTSLFGLAAAIGPQDRAAGTGFAPLAVAIGNNSLAFSGVNSLGPIPGNNVGNVAIAVGDHADAAAAGIGSSGVVLGAGNTFANARGVLSSAVVLFSSNTAVSASQGPLTFAASFVQSNATVNQTGPGFNINGLALGGTAAPSTAAASATAASKKVTATSTKAASSKKSTAGSKKASAARD